MEVASYRFNNTGGYTKNDNYLSKVSSYVPIMKIDFCLLYKCKTSWCLYHRRLRRNKANYVKAAYTMMFYILKIRRPELIKLIIPV